MKTDNELIPWYVKLYLYLWIKCTDWPVYRVTYQNLERTRALGYLEAKGCADVWSGRLWIDYGCAYFFFHGKYYSSSVQPNK
jgi:hypothetical protein